MPNFSVMELGRDECVQANKYLWCDQVLHPSTVGDGNCNPENNVRVLLLSIRPYCVVLVSLHGD